MRSSPSGSPVSSFLTPRMIDGGRPCPGKIWVQKRSTPYENSRAVQISPHNSGTIRESEKSSINANRKSTMGFPMSNQPRSCVTPNFPKRVQIPKFVVFRRNFDQKPLSVSYKVSLCKYFQRQRCCSAINYLSNGINILAEDDPVPVIFGLKAPTPNRKDARFTSHAARCAVSDSRPSWQWPSMGNTCTLYTCITERCDTGSFWL